MQLNCFLAAVLLAQGPHPLRQIVACPLKQTALPEAIDGRNWLQLQEISTDDEIAAACAIATSSAFMPLLVVPNLPTPNTDIYHPQDAIAPLRGMIAAGASLRHVLSHGKSYQ
jgi:hypothetical protein